MQSMYWSIVNNEILIEINSLSSPNIWAVPPNVCPEPVEYTEIDLKTKSIIARLLSKIPLNLPDEVLEFFFMN